MIFNTTDKPEIEEIIAAWQQYIAGMGDWRKLVEGVTPKQTYCGPVYEPPSPLSRPNESFAIADMRDISVAEPHYHTGGETEVYFVLSGSGLTVIGDQELEIVSGDVIVTPPETAHFTIPKDNLVLVVINTPPFSPQNNIRVDESSPAAGFDKAQFERLKAQVPYHSNPGNACALACYTMVAQYLLPDTDITFEQLGKVAGWRKGYVVWEFPIWKWLLDRGVRITDYDVIDYETWVNDGVAGLQRSIPAEEFRWYKENTYNLDEVTEHIRAVFAHRHFSFNQRKSTWDDVLAEHAKPGICDIVLNLRILNHQEGFAPHRVVLLDITDKEVVFHDPNYDGSGAHRREPIALFKKAIETMESPALARYSLT